MFNFWSVHLVVLFADTWSFLNKLLQTLPTNLFLGHLVCPPWYKPTLKNSKNEMCFTFGPYISSSCLKKKKLVSDAFIRSGFFLESFTKSSLSWRLSLPRQKPCSVLLSHIGPVLAWTESRSKLTLKIESQKREGDVGIVFNHKWSHSSDFSAYQWLQIACIIVYTNGIFIYTTNTNSRCAETLCRSQECALTSLRRVIIRASSEYITEGWICGWAACVRLLGFQ